MRGHDNRVGSIPGISMPPNHRFSTYRLSPPLLSYPRLATSYRSLYNVLPNSYPRGEACTTGREQFCVHDGGDDEEEGRSRSPLSHPRYFRIEIARQRNAFVLISSRLVLVERIGEKGRISCKISVKLER